MIALQAYLLWDEDKEDEAIQKLLSDPELRTDDIRAAIEEGVESHQIFLGRLDSPEALILDFTNFFLNAMIAQHHESVEVHKVARANERQLVNLERLKKEVANIQLAMDAPLVATEAIPNMLAVCKLFIESH